MGNARRWRRSKLSKYVSDLYISKRAVYSAFFYVCFLGLIMCRAPLNCLVDKASHALVGQKAIGVVKYRVVQQGAR